MDFSVEQEFVGVTFAENVDVTDQAEDSVDESEHESASVEESEQESASVEESEQEAAVEPAASVEAVIEEAAVEAANVRRPAAVEEALRRGAAARTRAAVEEVAPVTEAAPAAVEDGEKKMNILDVEIANENIALNVLVHFVNLANKRGAFEVRESAKIWECIQKFQRQA